MQKWQKGADKNSSGSHTFELLRKILFWPSWPLTEDFLRQGRPSKYFSQFCYASPEIIGVKVRDRQTDSHKFFDTKRTSVWIFPVKFVTPLLASLTGG